MSVVDPGELSSVVLPESEDASVRPRRASGRRYRAYRRTAKELDAASKDKGLSDDELREKADAARAIGGREGVVISRRRSGSRSRGFRSLLGEFWKIAESQRTRIVLSLAVAAVGTGLALLPLYAPKIVIDYVILGDAGTQQGVAARPDALVAFLGAVGLPADSRIGLLYVVVGVSVVIAMITLVLTLWSRWQATLASKHTTVRARRLAFDHAVRLPLNRVHDIKSGGVSSILRDDAGSVGELVFSLLYNPLKAIVQLVLSLAALAFIRWELLLGVLIVVPVVWFTHRTWINRIRPLWRDVRTTRQVVDAHATEAFGGMRVVRTFNRGRSEAGSFAANNHLMARQELYTWWWMRGIDSAWQIIIPLATAGLLLFGGILGARGGMTAGDLTTFLAFLLGLLQPIAMLATSATGLQNQLAGLDRTLDLVGEESEFAEAKDATPVRRRDVQGHVRLEGVHYAYPSAGGDLGDESVGRGTEVLRGVDLDVPAGTTVAFVGPSGAGKTTLCNLIARFHDPTGGRVLLDGRDLRSIEVDSYRSLLGIVEQDTFLFDGTIAQNIAYGRRDATLADVEHAAKLANAHEFISKLDEGYGSLIGERGVKLSGGQRQRLTIARAILADPKILILDEATSNLDTESERLIQRSLSELMRDRTSFVIAHRLSTIRAADVIAVIDGGRLVEQGTHDELMSRSGKYRQMVELQTERTGPHAVAAAA